MILTKKQRFKSKYLLKNNKIHKSGYYIDRFISLKCSTDMLSLRLFPNAKEITESFAAFECVSNWLHQYEFSNPDIVVVVIGDGNKPRTAAMFAFRSRWQCYSIDPQLDHDHSIRRLTVIPKKIEQVKLEFDKLTIIIHVHSHAPIVKSIENINAPERFLISISCCYKDNIGEPTATYIDEHIWSPKNIVNIYSLDKGPIYE